MRSTPEQKQAALTLARTGKYYCAEIARTLGMRHQTVQDLCMRNEIKLPLGHVPGGITGWNKFLNAKTQLEKHPS
jgi:hypothetical protein